MSKTFNHNMGPSILLSSNQLNPSAPWAGSDLLALGEPPLSSRIIRGQGRYQFFLFSSLLSLLSELDGVDKPHSYIFFASNDCHTGGATVFGTPYNVVQRPILQLLNHYHYYFHFLISRLKYLKCICLCI